MTKPPSKYHSDLDEEVITQIGKIIKQTYSDCIEYFLEDMGDSKWTLGVRRYEWVCKRIKDAINNGDLPNVSIFDDTGLTFVIKIGDVPVKFKRTDVDNPCKDALIKSPLESEQLSLLKFAGIKDPRELCWRILVNDDAQGYVSDIVFVGAYENGDIECYWPLDLKDETSSTNVNDNKDSGVEQPSPQVTIRSNENTQTKKNKEK